MASSKKLYQELKKENEEVNRKAENMFESLSKRVVLEFRHERFKEIESKVNELIKGEN